jgi:hypothetical protein
MDTVTGIFSTVNLCYFCTAMYSVLVNAYFYLLLFSTASFCVIFVAPFTVSLSVIFAAPSTVSWEMPTSILVTTVCAGHAVSQICSFLQRHLQLAGNAYFYLLLFSTELTSVLFLQLHLQSAGQCLTSIWVTMCGPCSTSSMINCDQKYVHFCSPIYSQLGMPIRCFFHMHYQYLLYGYCTIVLKKITVFCSAIYSQLGNAYFYLGDYVRAMQYHKHDLTLARTMGDR